MARQGKNLDAALRFLQSPTGTSNNQPPAGSILENWKQYRSGETVPSYTRSAESNPEELEPVAVNPFFSALGTGDEAKIQTVASKRALDLAALSSVKAATNLEEVVPDGVVPNAGFTPAKATVRNPGATKTFSPTTSQKTGIPYRALDAPSYTFPYGQTTGEIYESEVRADILNAVNAIANATVGFTPERIR